MTVSGEAFKPLLAKVADRSSLTAGESEQAFDIMMSGEATSAQIGGFLMALRLRGETTDEITGAVRTMRAKARKIEAPEGAIDVVGTGGDGSGTFNISTATALVVAGCGVPVAKHGNRAFSSLSGAADVLSALGVDLETDPETVARAIAEANIGFLMAPLYHSAMRHVGPARSELGIRTIFNILGPLSNPASVKRLVVGTFDGRWLAPMAHVLGTLGAERAWIVNGSDGMDEITTTGITYVYEYKDKRVIPFEIDPTEYGIELVDAKALKGGDPNENAEAIRRLLQGDTGAYRDIVTLNAAAALVVADKAPDIGAGLEIACAAIDDGSAMTALEKLLAITGVKK